MKRTYITGLGFVGKHLCNRLGAGNFIAVPHEKIHVEDFSEATRVFFLSTYGNMSSHTDVNAIVRANVSDLISVLSQINWKKIDSFVYFSTSSVKLRVQTTYSRTKRAAEEILLAYMEKYSAPITIIRPMSVTGVGEQEAHLIPTLIRSCLVGEHMKFVESPVHDFIDVRDVVEGTLVLSDDASRGIFELGTGVAHSNKEVLDIVERITGKKANTTIVPSMREYDNKDWVSHNFKVRSLGWLPQITLAESVADMVGGQNFK